MNADRKLNIFQKISNIFYNNNNYNDNGDYDLLESLPILTIILYKFSSSLKVIAIILNYLIFILWNLIWNNNISKPTFINYESKNCYSKGEKPPQCLIDNNLGIQSYVKLQGIKYHYVEAGSYNKKLLILLHGFPDCWIGWHNQITVLAEHFRVIALDLKGFSESDKPKHNNAYDPKTICFEIGKIIESFDKKSATIIGHDLGGTIGWLFAHTNPDKIDKLIVISSPHPNILWDNLSLKSPKNKDWLQLVQMPYIAERQCCADSNNFLKINLPQIYSQPQQQKQIKLQTQQQQQQQQQHQHHQQQQQQQQQKQQQQQERRHDQQHQQHQIINMKENENNLMVCKKLNKNNNYTTTSNKLIRNNDNENYDIIHNKMNIFKYLFNNSEDWNGPLNYYRTFPFYRIRENETIRCPCLILNGSEDKCCSLESLVKSTEYCDNYFIKIIDNSGHWPHQEAVLECNKIILNYLIGRNGNKIPIEKPPHGLVGRMIDAVNKVTTSYKK